MPFSLMDLAGGSGTHAELRQATNNPTAIRKTLKIAVCASKPMEPPKSVVTIDAGKAKITVPQGVFPVGLIDPKGVVVKAKTTTDPVKSLGEGTTRSDIVEVERDLAVTIQQSHRKEVMEMMLGQDLSGITPSASGELVIKEESVPVASQWMLWLFGFDVNKRTGLEIAQVKLLTNCSLSEAPGFTWAEKGPNDYDLGFDVMTDTKYQTHCVSYLGGPGLTDLYPELGWTAPAGA